MAGHLFIVQGDLTKLACDAWIVPTDAQGHVMEHWTEALGAEAIDAIRHEGPMLTRNRAALARPAADGQAAIIAVHSGRAGVDADWYADGLLRAVRLASECVSKTPRHGRACHLIAVPLVGTGAGGAGRFRGEVVREEVQRLFEHVRAAPYDVVLVTFSRRSLAAAQTVRRTLERPWSELTDAHELEAQRLGRLAIKQQLVLFLGAGVSVGAGMPTWNGLLEALAMSAGIDPDTEEFKRLDVLDKAEILRRGLGQDRFRAQIREHFGGHHQALAHQLLASLPVTEAATTNYDTLFEAAWRSVEPEGGRVAALPAESPKGADRWLLKLHGSVEPDGSELVLCREDYLRLGSERAALSGVVHAMLLTRHMLFVGFSLTDDTFHRIAHEVRAVLGPPDKRPGSAPFGTALTPTGGDLSRRLWEGDIDLVDLSDGSLAAAYRNVEIFLDRLAAETSDPVSYLLDPSFASLLSDEERALAHSLRDIAGQLPSGRAGEAIGALLTDAGHVHHPPPRSRRDQASAASSRERQYAQFWSSLLGRVAHEQPGWVPRRQTPSSQNWLNFHSERFHPAYYAMSFARGGRLRTELYIDHGSRRASEDLYQRLRAERELIESRYGEALAWEPLPGRLVCRVASYTPGHIDEDHRHDEYIGWFVTTGAALRRALGEH